MSARASGTFTVKSWDETPVTDFEGGGKLTRASIAGTYSGELEGEATTETVMCYRADGTATYVSFERVVGKIGGRAGSFVLRGTGSYDGSEAKATMTVVPGSGTGELAGLRGEGKFRAPHGPQGEIELEYQFER